jgi:hypothetical protein
MLMMMPVYITFCLFYAALSWFWFRWIPIRSKTIETRTREQQQLSSSVLTSLRLYLDWNVSTCQLLVSSSRSEVFGPGDGEVESWRERVESRVCAPHCTILPLPTLLLLSSCSCCCRLTPSPSSSPHLPRLKSETKARVSGPARPSIVLAHIFSTTSIAPSPAPLSTQ